MYQAYRGVGVKAYDPIRLLAMAAYMILKGVNSPAQWEEKARINDAMKWLGRGYQPSRSCWYNFRDRMADFIEEVNALVVGLAREEHGVNPETVVQDGTNFGANASRHRMLNRKTLAKRRRFLQEVIDGRVDVDLPQWVPPTPAGCLRVARWMEQAAIILERRIAENAKKPKDKRKDPEKIVVSVSDPDAPLGRDKQKVFRPLYTIQFMVDPTSDLIVAYQCEPSVSDTGTLAPMVDKAVKVLGDSLQHVIADAAYCTILDLRDCIERGIDLVAPVQENTFSKPKQNTNGVGINNRDQFDWDEATRTYTCPAGHQLQYHSKQKKLRADGRTLDQYRYHCKPEKCMVCPLAPECVKNPSSGRTLTRMEGQELLDQQREKMKTEKYQDLYSLRSQFGERGFADAKGNRNFQRYHGRGIRRARAETGLLVLAQNLMRLDRLQKSSATQEKQAT